MSTEQKPPIDITPNIGPKAGPLDPSEPRPRLTQQKSGGSGGGGTNWMPAIVAIVVSLALSALMVFVFNPTKAGIDTLSSQIIELDNRAITLEADSSRLDTFISTSANYATQGDLTGLTNGMATESSVSDLQSSIDSLRNENGFLNDRIAELEIVEAIEEEEAEEEAAEVPTDAQVWIDLGYSERVDWVDDDANTSTPLVPEGVDGVWECTQALAFEIVNESDVDIEDIEIEIVIHSQGHSMYFGTPTISDGYPLDLRVVHVDSNVIVLNGSTPSWSDGLEVEAEDNENIYFNLVMPCTEEPDTSRLYVEAEVTDFKIVE